MTVTTNLPQDDQATALIVERVFFELRKVIVGQSRLIERMLVGLLSQGHCLLESVPGLAKTLAAETLSKVVGGTFGRVQFTPDLLPSDIVGTRIFRSSSEKFDVELGPVFVNFLLADEINRAPAKVQSALLEVMAEQHVTIGGDTYHVPTPFFVIATQNPIESEGVYQLPEAQRDRFMMKITMTHPSADEEMTIVDRMSVSPPIPEQVIDLDGLADLQRRADAWCSSIAACSSTRSTSCRPRATPAQAGMADLEPVIALGASPRATLALVRGAKALALLRGRTYATPQEIFDLAPEILRHRLILTYDALARDISIENVLKRMLSTVPHDVGVAEAERPRAARAEVAAKANNGRALDHDRVAERSDAGLDRRAPALLGVHDQSSPRRPTARAAPRDHTGSRQRAGRIAAVPTRRRCSPHRLERHRAHP